MTRHFNQYAKTINGNVITNEVGTRADMLYAMGSGNLLSIQSEELAAA